jgi:hypothetical protein
MGLFKKRVLPLQQPHVDEFPLPDAQAMKRQARDTAFVASTAEVLIRDGRFDERADAIASALVDQWAADGMPEDERPGFQLAVTAAVKNGLALAQAEKQCRYFQQDAVDPIVHNAICHAAISAVPDHIPEGVKVAMNFGVRVGYYVARKGERSLPPILAAM